ncbi:MAG TPA: hypothetical protein VER17_02720 [Tepidisphaeraceae bacterium]|nr:hypothetical protein [Tepidisphaeraceae bacterium]
MFESLEDRRFLSATIAPNPSDNAPNENANTIGVQSSAVTGNGVVVSEQGKAGTRGAIVSALASNGKSNAGA